MACLVTGAMLQVAQFHESYIEPILEHLCTQLLGGTGVESVLQYLLILRCIFMSQEAELAARMPAVQVRPQVLPVIETASPRYLTGSSPW